MHRGRLVANGSVGDVVRGAGLASGARVTVGPTSVGIAESALGSIAKCRLGHDPTRRRVGELDVMLAAGGDLNAVAAALIEAEIDIRSLVGRGARLSDAFLELTAAGRSDGSSEQMEVQ